MSGLTRFRPALYAASLALALAGAANVHAQTGNAQEEGWMPLAEGKSYEMLSGFFNAELAEKTGGYTLHDIILFSARTGGWKGGRKTFEVVKGKNKGELQLIETYQYSERERVDDQVREAVPASTRVYQVEVANDMTTIVGERGQGKERIHLLPTQPTAGLEWHWNTSAEGFELGQLSATQAEEAGYNASGKIVEMSQETTGFSSAKKYSCVHVEITIGGITTHWWWDREEGLIRYGGENLGISRELLAITAPDDEGREQERPMDQAVYFRR